MDPVPDEREVARFIAERFPDWREEPVTRLRDAGTVHAIYRIGRLAALRLPFEVDEHTLERMRGERTAAARFAEVATVPAPWPLAVGDDGLGRPWVVQTWVAGTIATPTGSRRSAGIADDLADLIRTLRAAPTKGAAFSGPGRGGDLRDHDDWMAQCFRESEGLIDVGRIRTLWERLRELPRESPDAMTHGDLTPQNLVLRGDHLAGVLDADGFGPADPALDLVVAWHAFDRPRRRVLRDAVGGSDLEWRRGAAWALEQAMGLVWYYRESLPGMSALGRTTLTRLLEDPEL